MLPRLVVPNKGRQGLFPSFRPAWCG